MRSDPDVDLVRDCQSGSPRNLSGPFRELYDRFRDRVYNVCFRITGNPSDALDASQETFGILFRKISEFRFQSKFSSWVYRIAVNASIDLKRRSSSRRLASLDVLDEPRAGGSSRAEAQDDGVEMPLASVTRAELEQEVQRAISRLSPKLQTVIVLRYIESQSYEEVSQTLGISIGTVKSRLARAHDALDRELTPVLDRHYLG